WTSSDTRVTRTSIALLSGSTRTPTVAIGPPSAGIHPHVRSATNSRAQTARAAPNEIAIAAIETRPAPRPVRRSGPTIASSRNAPKGSARTSSGSPTSRVTALSPEQVEAVRLDRPPHAEDCDHDREPHGDFRDGDGDREQREDQPGEVAVEARERDQVDVDGVQHQLDPEQDADRVAAGQDPEETDREHERGQDQIRREPDHSSPRAK